MNDRLTAVMDNATRNRDEFERFCQSLSGEQLNRPIPASHWRVKDYITHLATIDTWVGGEWFEAVASGTPFILSGEGGGQFDIDGWNDARVNERRDANLDDLFAEAAKNRGALFSTFPRFKEETLASRFVFRKNEISFLEYLEAWTLHDPAHAMDMLKALPEKRADPQVRAWLAAFSSEAMSAVADVNANSTNH